MLASVLSVISHLLQDVLVGKEETAMQLVQHQAGRMLIDAINKFPTDGFQDKEQMNNAKQAYNILHHIMQAQFGHESILSAECEGKGIDGLWLRLNAMIKYASSPGRLASDVLRCYDVTRHQLTFLLALLRRPSWTAYDASGTRDTPSPATEMRTKGGSTSTYLQRNSVVEVLGDREFRYRKPPELVITFLVNAARWFQSVAKDHGKSDFLLPILTSIGKVARGQTMLPDSPTRDVSYVVNGQTITTRKAPRVLSEADAKQTAFLCLARLFQPPVPRKSLASTLFSLLGLCSRASAELEKEHIIPKMCALLKNVASTMKAKGSLPLPIYIIWPCLGLLLGFGGRDKRNLCILTQSRFLEIVSLLADYLCEHVHEESLGEVTFVAQIRLVLKCFGIFYAILWHEPSKLDAIAKTENIVANLVSVVRTIDLILSDMHDAAKNAVKTTRTPTPLTDTLMTMKVDEDYADEYEEETDHEDDNKFSEDVEAGLQGKASSMMHGIRGIVITSLALICKSSPSYRRLLSRDRKTGDFLVTALRNTSSLKGKSVDTFVANGVIFTAGSGNLTSCLLDLLSMYLHMSQYRARLVKNGASNGSDGETEQILLCVFAECERVASRVNKQYRAKAWVRPTVQIKERQVVDAVNTWKEIFDAQRDGIGRRDYGRDEHVIERAFRIMNLFIRSVDSTCCTENIRRAMESFLEVAFVFLRKLVGKDGERHLNHSLLQATVVCIYGAIEKAKLRPKYISAFVADFGKLLKKNIEESVRLAVVGIFSALCEDTSVSHPPTLRFTDELISKQAEL